MRSPLSQRIRLGVLAATILGSSMVFIDSSVVNVILPRLQNEFKVTSIQVQWVVEAYLLFLSTLILLGGALGDRYGKTVVFQIGTAIFVGSSIGCSLSASFWQLTLFRSIQGIGGALLTPGSLAIIDGVFPKEERGKAIGTWSGFSAVTTAIGPVLGGYLSDHASWRWIFLLNLPLGILTILFTRKYVPRECGETGTAPLDLPGVLSSTLGLGVLTFAFIESGNPSLLALGFSLLVVFVWIESRVKDPLVPLWLFRSKVFFAANLCTLFLYAALGAGFYFLPFNLIQVQGFTAAQAGAANLPFVFTLFFMSRWAGGLYDRFGPRRPLTLGSTFAGLGFLALGFFPGIHSGYWLSFFPGIFLFGLGMSICIAPLTTAVLGSAPIERAGLASGINNSTARIAGLIAIAALNLWIVLSFRSHLSSELHALSIHSETQSALMNQADRLAAIDTTVSENAQLSAKLREAVDFAYLKSFREVMIISASLCFISAATAFSMLKKRPD